MKKLLVVLALVCGVASFSVADEIKIGATLPLSGAMASFGKSALEGINLRIAELNAAGGINGVQLKLIVEDDQGDATTTINTYNKLAGSDKVCAVIGPITSTAALAIRRAVSEAKVPVISPTATNDKVTRKHGYMFRACFNDSFQGRVIANYIAKDAKTAATLTDMNSDYSKGLSRSFGEALVAQKGDIVADEVYQQKDTDFGAQLKKIKDSGAQIVFVPGYPPELPLIIKQAKAVGLTAKLCGADGWDNESVINGSGDNVDGCLLVGAFSPDDKRETVQTFVANFQKSAGHRPGTFEALGYDSASMVAEALKTGTQPEDVRKGLFGIKNFEAVTGAITVNSDGDSIKSAVILKIAREGDHFTTTYVSTVAPF